MTSQLFLITPPETDPSLLAPALAGGGVSALLLRRGNLSENTYKNWARRLVPIGQDAGSAVLIEGEPGWVRALGADGIHVPGPLEAVREAVAALKPELIVGADATRSRHEAMLRGELELDYLMFGTPEDPLDPASVEMAAWWTETMEIPAVLSDPEAEPDRFDPHGCEFLALSRSVWQAPAGPAAALAAFSQRLEAAA